MVSNDLKRKIYHYIDENGFMFSKKSIAFSGSVDLAEGTIDFDFSNRDIITPVLNQFKVSRNDLEEIIKDYVFETTGVKIESIEQLLKLKSMNGFPFFVIVNENIPDKQFFTLAFPEIKGSIVIRKGSGISSLGNIEMIRGDLGLSDCNLKSFGNLQQVDGNLWNSGNGLDVSFKRFEFLERVGGDLSIENSVLTDLGSLTFVGRSLNLRNTPLDSLGNLNFVGWNLNLPLPCKDKFDLSKIEIRGKVKYWNA